MYQDSYEILSKELQSAKVAAGLAGIVKRKEGAEMALLDQGIDPETIIDSTAAATTTQVVAKNYDNLEALTGGYLEYLDPDDDFQIQNWNRPNIALKDFLDRVTTSSGASLGLSKTYATLTPAGSYTAFRGDMLLAWSQFRWDQKTLEQQLCDWVAIKAITLAIRKGILPVAVPDAFDRALTWIWPDMPAVDELKARQADTEGLANLTVGYAELLGPNWRAKLAAMAEQRKLIEELGLKIGASSEATTDEQPDDMDNRDNQDEDGDDMEQTGDEENG